MKSIIGGIVLVTLVSPALADEYWVDYNYSTHECSIVEKNSPDTAANTAQGTTAADTTNVIAPNDQTTPDATQGTTAADSAKVATTSDATQGANAANTIAEAAASGVAPVIVMTAPNDQSTSDATKGANAANTTTGGGASDAPNAATTSGTPTNTSPCAKCQTWTSTGDDDSDPFKSLAATWARKKAAAEAAGTDTTHALIGTAMHSREEAENEMQIMRKCGLRP